MRFSWRSRNASWNVSMVGVSHRFKKLFDGLKIVLLWLIRMVMAGCGGALRLA